MPPPLDSRPAQEILIRPMDGLDDFQRAEQVQREAWGYNDIDVAPASIFSVARNFGGQALGAFDGERMVGFALSFGAVDGGMRISIRTWSAWLQSIRIAAWDG